MTDKTYIIGSRGSDLALWQAHFFQDQMKKIGVKTEVKIIKTKGDKVQHLGFDKMEGKGFFTKEIEQALHDKEIDVAIHSHKDLETSPTAGLVIAGVSKREDPSELLLIRPSEVDQRKAFHLKEGAIVGTSSARRKGQITDFRSDLNIKDIRGNVPTRIQKLRDGDYDAILIAYAGVHRLGINLDGLHVQKLHPAIFIPAPAQGVLAYQCRENDQDMIDIIGKVNNPRTKAQIEVERTVLSTFGGGCQVPMGVYAEPGSNGFYVRVAHSKEWSTFSHRVTFIAKNWQQAKNVFTGLKTANVNSPVLITKDLGPGSFLRQASESHGFELDGKPFITLQPQKFEAPDYSAIDWIFFSSANAVKHFAGRTTIPAHIKLAAVGEGTARALVAMTKRAADFVGLRSDIDSVARDFASQIEGGKVLFPQSNISKQSIQAALEPSQVENLVVYVTIKSTEKLATDYASIVFTSPSNVQAFFESGNQWAPLTEAIAIGQKTAQALKNYGISSKVAAFPTEPEIYSLLARGN